ncbi:MAG: EAL domain-containing protein [Proteobacteria bacterium]|nr:EAL domain-containing protein [Pseudomonadota bacterium]
MQEASGMGWTAFTSRMGRRIALVLGPCAAVPVVLFALVAAREASSEGAAIDERRLLGVSSLYADVIRSRIGVAETIVETFTIGDLGPDSSRLREQIAHSRALKSVVVVNRDGVLAGGETTLRPSPAQSLALEAGQTILMPVTLDGQLTGTFLVRLVSSGGVGKLAYFEMAPDWLWKDLKELPATSIAVVDADGKVLYNPRPLANDTSHMFAEHITLLGERGGSPDTLAWQDGGVEWHGVLKHVPLINERVTTIPWGVVAYTKEIPFFTRSKPYWAVLPYILGVLVLCGLIGARYLARRYLGSLQSLRVGLPGLQARRFEPLPLTGSDEPRELIEHFNRSAANLREQFQALETLGEIDKLLLGSAELEQVLENILARVQTVTRCHCVGITLRDADAPGRGRVFLAGNNLTDLPVTRVELDDDMLTTLMAESRGLTVARCEETRHSFLWPLKEIGAELFWVWPVNVAERVEAILAVGYREVPAADLYLTRSGSQFAERLALALSKTARDERLYRQAHYDPLTSLPNRILFRDRLAQEIANATAGLSRGALLYIDLDHFKRVNDSVGHSAGDQLLASVAQRLRSCVKDDDTVARLGGDEFTVILRNVADPGAARTVGERIIEALQLPVNIGGRDHFVCTSIGITLFPDDGFVIDDVMRNADTAMYRAKDLGRGCTMFFDPNMNVKATVPTDTGLHRALRRREFSLFYQPQFTASNGALAGVEALIRWQTARDGIRQPSEFVPAAEASGLIIDIGGWVLDAACAQFASWRDQNMAPPRLALNVSVQQLKHSEFPKLVRRALDKYGLAPALLELELTESVFADDAAGVTLERLHQMGVHLALDDFGTGYSSLSYLRQYPIGTVKIDRTLFEEVPQNPASATLVETIIVMAHALGKRVVAEGIETHEQLEFLRERGCDIAQGFYLARPLSSEVVTELLQARTHTVDEQFRDVREVG